MAGLTIVVTADDVVIGTLPDGTDWSMADHAGMPHDGSFPEPLLVRIAVRRFDEWIKANRPDWNLTITRA